MGDIPDCMRREEGYNMLIRRAKASDMEGINKLLYQVCMVHHIGRPDLFKAGAKKYTDKELLDIIEDDKTPILVAVDEEDTLLGYAFCIFLKPDGCGALMPVKTLYIDDLCVDENIRGQHIGKSLYEAVLAFAKKSDCYNVTLNVWSCNPDAMKFYEACGLKPQKIGMEVIL